MLASKKNYGRTIPHNVMTKARNKAFANPIDCIPWERFEEEYYNYKYGRRCQNDFRR